MTHSVIERMAEAIFLKEGRNKDVAWKDADNVLILVTPEWGRFKSSLKPPQLVSDYYRDIARAALAAAREPTDSMHSAGREAFAIGDLPLPDEVWEAMIDAALEEK